MKKTKLLMLLILFTLFTNAFSQQTIEIFEPQKYGLSDDCAKKIDPVFLAMFGKAEDYIEKSKSITPLKRNFRGEIVLSAIIKTNNIHELKSIEGIVIGSIHGDIVTATFKFHKLIDIANLNNTIYIEASIFCYNNLDESIPETKANSVWIPQGGYISTIKGENVLIGIMDTGIDWNHKDFIDNDEIYPSNPINWQTRVMYIWDQTLTNDSNYSVSSPIGYTYGLEYSTTEINNAIQGGNPIATEDSNGHGTHVAGIAAGDGTSTDNTYVGIAPESKLIICKNTGESIWNFGQTTTGALDGFSWMIDKANELTRPLIINQSQGINTGPHDGTTLYEQAINYDALNNNLKIVTAAGNNRNDEKHVAFNIPGNDHHEFEMNFEQYSSDVEDRKIQFWYDASDNFSIRIRPDVMTVDWSEPIALNTASTQIAFGIDGISGQINISNLNSPLNGDNVIDINVYYLGSTPFYSLTWFFDIIDNDVQSNETIHGYIERYPTGAHFTEDIIEDGTICMPASASEAISVASYNTKLSWLSINGEQTYQNPNPIGYISAFSSKGPLRNEIYSSKPDITAPGKGIASSYSSYANWNNDWILSENSTIQHAISQGTSMSAPHVTGSCALLLQKFPNLISSKLKSILKENANSSYPTGDEKDWGAGKLDILAAYQSMVGFSYNAPYQYDEDKFKNTFEEHEDIAGLPIEPVQINWNGVNYFKQKLTSGALFLDQSGLNEAFWIGENIWNNWIYPSSIGLPVSSQYLDIQNNFYQTVDFENCRIYWDWNIAHIIYLRADFETDIINGSAPLAVVFNDLSVGNITSWEWDFNNDGTIDSYDQNPTYTYQSPGVYTVSLTISDGTDIHSKIQTNLIEVYGLGNYTEVRITNNNANSEWPAIDFDNSNNASLVWQDSRDGNWEIYFCRIDEINSIIVPVTRITQTGSSSTKPDVGVDAAGNSYIVWDESGSIKYCKMDASGNKVVDNLTIASGNLPAISTQDDGTSGIAWEQTGVLHKTLFEKRDTSGNIIGSILTLNSLAYNVEKNCYIDHDEQNNFYVWRLELGNWFSHYYHIAKIATDNSIPYNGAMFQATDNSKECCLGITQEDNAYLFYVDRSDGYYQIFNGSQELQTSGDGDSRYPNIALNPENTDYFTLIWEDDRNGNWEVIYTKYDNNYFQSEQILNNDGENSRHPNVSCNTNGVWSLVWEEYKNGNSEIYYMKMDYVTPSILLPPENVSIICTENTVSINWDPVEGSTFYLVYSSNNPNTGFIVDNSGTFVGNNWTAPLTNEKKFFYVKGANSLDNTFRVGGRTIGNEYILKIEK